MKFDFAIGNPPYQEDRQGNSNTALPIYHQFMEAAYSVSNATELITPARFLFNAGRTPKDWNQKMLRDEHFKVMEYEADASTVFSNTDIKGGIAITYRDKAKKYGAIETFTIHEEINGVLRKIYPCIEKGGAISNIAFVASKFNTSNLFRDYPQYEGHERRMSSNILEFDCFHEKKDIDDILIYGIYKGKRYGRFINKKYVDMTDKQIEQYKIITPKADGDGTFGDKLTNPEILKPMTGFTHTFLGIGSFEKEQEALSALKYIKTKFARTLLSVLKITQDINADKWKYVPLQDFTEKSDIEWSVSIANIDKQLYKKYRLSGEEIAFIENNVKEME